MDFLAVANDGSIWIKSLRVDGVTLAAVDDAGLPYRVSPGKEFFYKYNFSSKIFEISRSERKFSSIEGLLSHWYKNLIQKCNRTGIKPLSARSQVQILPDP